MSSTTIAYWDTSTTDGPVNMPDFPPDAYEMVITPATVQSNLTIKSIALDDEALYMCVTGYIPSPSPTNNISVTVLGKYRAIMVTIIVKSIKFYLYQFGFLFVFRVSYSSPYAMPSPL